MISAGLKQELQSLQSTQNSYRPRAAIVRELARKTIVMLVGATCEGKSTIMHTIANLDDRFGPAGTLTTRPPRDDDGPRYTYYEYSDTGLRPLLNKIKDRRLVQYALNPFNLQVYGSEPEDYPYDYNLLDVLASAVQGFRQLGFGRLHTITLNSEPEAWLSRFGERFPPGHEQRRARRDEAIQSFSWSLAQSDTNHLWAENLTGDPTAAAHTITDIVLAGGQGNPEGRQWCLQSLALAREIEA
jgi:hypothetical protein